MPTFEERGPELSRLVPWLPESFWRENFDTISKIFGTITHHYPEIAVHRLTDEDVNAPTEQTRKWMWQRFMGGQHGFQRGSDGKVPIRRDQEHIIQPYIEDLHYGPYGFLKARMPSSGHYDKALVLGGTPSENSNRLNAAINGSPLESDIDEIIFMAGQRSRWDVPGEATIPDIYQTIHEFSGVDIDKLRDISPFIKEQEARQGLDWDRPYPSEFELARLSVEATFIDAIDWHNYDVEMVYDETANALPYIDKDGSKKTFPARELAMVTYTLIDGRQVHVTNGRAIQRPQGEPKPTSDSTMRETVSLLNIGQEEKSETVVIGTSVPHFRAGLDALIRLLQMRGNAIARVDINSGSWERNYLELQAGLGEIPATHKADLRLHAVVHGEDPDSEELRNL